MLLLTMACYLFFYTGRQNFGWASTGMAEELHLSFSFVGWISSALLIGYAAGQLINGNLADRFSPRLMVVIGAYLSILTNVAISFASSANVILLLWGLNGYFQSLAWAPGGRLISNWWSEEERGKAFGFYTMSAGLSSVVTYLLSIVLLQQGYEWRMLFRLPILLLLVTATIFFLFVRDKPPVSIETPSQLREDQEPEHSWFERYKLVLGNGKFLMVCLALGFEGMARYGLLIWVPVHYLGKDWKSDPHALWVTILLPIGMALGALSFGWLSDKLFKGKRMNAILCGMGISIFITAAMYVVPKDYFVINAVLMLTAGFFVYGPQACFWPLSPDILGKKLTGTGIGCMNTFAYLFAGFGEPLIGKIIDATHNTYTIFAIIAVACVLSSLFIFIASRFGRQQKTS